MGIRTNATCFALDFCLVLDSVVNQFVLRCVCLILSLSALNFRLLLTSEIFIYLFILNKPEIRLCVQKELRVEKLVALKE